MKFKDLNKLEENKVKQVETKQEAKENRAVAGKLPILWVKKDKETGVVKPAAVKFLHSLDKSVDVAVHQIYSESEHSTSNLLCEEHWQDTCKYCKDNHYAKSVKCIISFIVSLVDKQWSIGDKKGAYNLTRLVMIPLGKNAVNVSPFTVADREKIFTERLWQLSKSKSMIKDKTGTTKVVWINNPPKILYEEDYKDQMGEAMPKFTYSDFANKVKQMPKEEIFNLIINTFDNGSKLMAKLAEDDKVETKDSDYGYAPDDSVEDMF